MISQDPFSRLVLSMAAVLFSATVAPLRAELVTFEVHGHMIEASTDFQIGDAFVADYTFDPSIPEDGYTAPDFDVQYLNIISWHFAFDRGYSFGPTGNSFSGYMELVNNSHNNLVYPDGFDRYIVTLTPVASTGLPMPSGEGVNFLQFDFQDWTPAGDADMLSGLFVPTTPPSIALSSSAYGRVDMNDGITQPYFAVDSITVVPEPSTAMLSVIAFGLLLEVDPKNWTT